MLKSFFTTPGLGGSRTYEARPQSGPILLAGNVKSEKEHKMESESFPSSDSFSGETSNLYWSSLASGQDAIGAVHSKREQISLDRHKIEEVILVADGMSMSEEEDSVYLEKNAILARKLISGGISNVLNLFTSIKSKTLNSVLVDIFNRNEFTDLTYEDRFNSTFTTAILSEKNGEKYLSVVNGGDSPVYASGYDLEGNFVTIMFSRRNNLNEARALFSNRDAFYNNWRAWSEAVETIEAEGGDGLMNGAEMSASESNVLTFKMNEYFDKRGFILSCASDALTKKNFNMEEFTDNARKCLDGRISESRLVSYVHSEFKANDADDGVIFVKKVK